MYWWKCYQHSNAGIGRQHYDFRKSLTNVCIILMPYMWKHPITDRMRHRHMCRQAFKWMCGENKFWLVRAMENQPDERILAQMTITDSDWQPEEWYKKRHDPGENDVIRCVYIGIENLVNATCPDMEDYYAMTGNKPLLELNSIGPCTQCTVHKLEGVHCIWWIVRRDHFPVPIIQIVDVFNLYNFASGTVLCIQHAAHPWGDWMFDVQYESCRMYRWWMTRNDWSGPNKWSGAHSICQPHCCRSDDSRVSKRMATVTKEVVEMSHMDLKRSAYCNRTQLEEYDAFYTRWKFVPWMYPAPLPCEVQDFVTRRTFD